MKNHCCNDMFNALNFSCEEHENPFDCPDALVFYDKVFDEYGLIIHDGGGAIREIRFCPWCGKKLPKSKRDLWFDTLEEMGFDDPTSQNIPDEFNSDLWYLKKSD